jgi:hypothetical protein
MNTSDASKFILNVPGKAISYSYLPTLFIHKKKDKEEKKNLHSFFFYLFRDKICVCISLSAYMKSKRRNE